MTNLTRYVYDENGSSLILDIPVTQVTEQWDGEIDASGILIQDAYNIEDIQITGNSSTDQLKLLSLILNVKSQLRLLNPEFNVLVSNGGSVSVTNIDRRIGGIEVTKCYKSIGLPIVSAYKMDGKFYNDDIITIPLTYQLIIDNADLFPVVDGTSVDTVPISYNDYKYYVDNGVNVEIPINKIAYYDANGDAHLLSEDGIQSRFNMYMVAYKNLVNEPVLIAEVNTIMDADNYKYFRRICSPGKSTIITGFTPDLDSTISATIQYNNIYEAQYARAICAGRFNNTNGLTSSFEDGTSGTLHVSCAGATSWTTYNTIVRDYDTHTYTFDKNSFYMDGNLIHSGATTTFTAEMPFTILGYIGSGVTEENSAYVYKASFSQNDVLQGVLIPAQNKTTGVYGLHDVMNDVFYTSDNLALTND